MSGLRFWPLCLPLFLCGCLTVSYDAKYVGVGEKIDAVNFNESQANEILDDFGISNRYVSEIERNSQGTALFAYFERIGHNPDRGVLTVGKKNIVTNFPGVTGPMGVHDDLTLAYSLQGQYYVFAGGQSLPAEGKTPNSWLSVIGSPGNEVLALNYYNNQDYFVIYAAEPQKPLFHLNAQKDIITKRIFYQNNTIFIFGSVHGAKGQARWECWAYRKNFNKWWRESCTPIPDADEVLDFDPESSKVLCSKWGTKSKKAFIFDMGTKKASKLDLHIWRDHGYLMRVGRLHLQ
jgi:hypothetical protein